MSARVINVQDYLHQAVKDGHWTNAVKSALDATFTNATDSHGGAVVYFPPGEYVIKSTLRVPNHRTHVIGAGHWVTKLVFAPDEDPAKLPNESYVLWEFKASVDTNVFKNEAWDPSTNVLWSCAIKGMTIFSDAPYDHLKKTAIKLVDLQTMCVEGIQVHNSFRGTGSIGLHILGRDTISINRVELTTERPVVIGRNPNSALTEALQPDALLAAAQALQASANATSDGKTESAIDIARIAAMKAQEAAGNAKLAANSLKEKATETESNPTIIRLNNLAKLAMSNSAALTNATAALTTIVGDQGHPNGINDALTAAATATTEANALKAACNLYHPYAALADADHVHFHDCNFGVIDTNPKGYIVDIESQHIQVLTFDGYQAWQSQCGGVKFAERPEATDFHPNQIAIRNVRLEGPDLKVHGRPISKSNTPDPDDGWFVYIGLKGMGLVGLTIENVLSHAYNGIYLEKVNQASIRHIDCSDMQRSYQVHKYPIIFKKLCDALRNDPQLSEPGILTQLPGWESAVSKALMAAFQADWVPDGIRDSPEPMVRALCEAIKTVPSDVIEILCQVDDERPASLVNLTAEQVVAYRTVHQALLETLKAHSNAVDYLDILIPAAVWLGPRCSSITLERIYHSEGDIITPDYGNFQYKRRIWVPGDTIWGNKFEPGLFPSSLAWALIENGQVSFPGYMSGITLTD